MGLASVAHVRGQSLSGSWYVLSKEIGAAADQILKVLNDGVDKTSLAAAVTACMSLQPATAAPLWTKPIWEDPTILDQIGNLAEQKWPPNENGAPLNSSRQRGLASLAIALCRSMDSVRAVALKLSESNGGELIKMAALAQSCVAPGIPSEERNRLRCFLKEIDNG